MKNFPSLEPSSSPVSSGHGTSSRVLVIKSRNTRAGGTRSTGKSKAGVWDRVASAASGASSGVSPRSSPHSSRPSSPAPMSFPTPNINGPRTAWAGSGHTTTSQEKKNNFPSLGKARSSAPGGATSSSSSKKGPEQHFPSLPTVPKRQNHLMSLRRNASNSQLNNVWGGEQPTEQEQPASGNVSDDQPGKKKKGKKSKQVLFRVGL